MSKRSVMDIPDWPGWDWFMDLYHEHIDTKYPEDSQAAFLLCFQGGFRASEAVLIRKDQIAMNEEAVIIYQAPVLKKKKKTTRDVWVLLDKANPLGPEFKELVENTKGEYVFPKRTGFERRLIPDKPSSRMSLYRRVNEIRNLFPHSLRAYRAMMLVHERGFTVQDLVKWFDWSKADMAVHYTRTRDMGTRLGVKNIPRLEDNSFI